MLRKDLILSLQSYEIDDPDWKEAMKVINDSMNVITKKEWIALRRRSGFAGKWKSVNLNFSSMGQED